MNIGFNKLNTGHDRSYLALYGYRVHKKILEAL